MKSPHLFATFAAGLAIALPASASLLVYEGFDSTATNGASISGVSGASSVGLAGSWGSAAGSGSQSATYNSTGLTFANFASTGGALVVATGNGTGAINAFREVTATVASGNTFYGSFLVRNNAANDRFVSVLGIETGAATNFAGTPITPHRLGDNDDPFRFTIAPDAYNTGGAIGTNALKVRRYGAGSFASGNGSAPLANSTTYLAVFKVTNAYVGDGSSGLTSQAVTVWFMNEANYSSIFAAGISEAELDANNASKISLANGLQASLTAGQFINIAGLAAGSVGANSTIYDEIRFGTTLDSVALSSIPEPASFAVLAGLGVLGLAASRRRARA